MPKSIKVSVIITTKNEESVIENLLISLQKQTFKDFEIIVVDNNSSDNTKLIAKKYKAKVFNKGPERSVQRNFGVSKAKGKYILILDADMELTPKVLEDCVKISEKEICKGLVVPEKTVGNDWFSKVRRFEREMYEGDLGVEVARFYNKKVFKEIGGYDVDLTGPEDYDFHYRVMKKYKIRRAKKYLYHNEQGTKLLSRLRKKYYYSKKGAKYAQKHPELVKTQGNILFRKAYFKNWKKFVKKPLLGISFVFVRCLETIFAVSGYISAVGLKKFIITFLGMFRKE